MHESPSAITIPLIILAILSVVGGFVGIPEVIKPDAHLLEKFLDPIFAESVKVQGTHEVHAQYRMDADACLRRTALIAVIFAWTRFSKKPELDEPKGFGSVLANKWYVDELYDVIIVSPLNALAKFLNNVVEKSDHRLDREWSWKIGSIWKSPDPFAAEWTGWWICVVDGDWIGVAFCSAVVPEENMRSNVRNVKI